MTFGLGGTDEGGEEFILLAHEVPERVHSEDVSKGVLERLHLERFRYDYVRLHGASPFEAVVLGADPPDFVVSTDKDSQRWDVASFALETRRMKLHLFERLVDRLATGTEGRDFSGLAGTVVSVWFGENLDQLPPRRSDDGLVTPLLDLLASTRVDQAAVLANREAIAREGGLPARIVDGAITTASTEDRAAGFIANVVCSPEESIAQLGSHGFQVTPHFPEQIALSDATGLLQRIVADHDKPEIETLLVTAGGPDRRGIRYPGEELVAAFLSERAVGLRARHLSAVTLHLWASGAIHEIPLRV